MGDDDDIVGIDMKLEAFAISIVAAILDNRQFEKRE